jgi:hypothetical protein
MKSFLVVHIAQETSITISIENGKEISDLKLEMTSWTENAAEVGAVQSGPDYDSVFTQRLGIVCRLLFST